MSQYDVPKLSEQNWCDTNTGPLHLTNTAWQSEFTAQTTINSLIKCKDLKGAIGNQVITDSFHTLNNISLDSCCYTGCFQTFNEAESAQFYFLGMLPDLQGPISHLVCTRCDVCKDWSKDWSKVALYWLVRNLWNFVSRNETQVKRLTWGVVFALCS